MRTIVTGAAGFIGSTLVDRLLAEGHVVVGIDNLSNGRQGNLASARVRSEISPGQFTLIQADIQHPELTGIFAGVNPDAVFHLAAHVDLRASVEAPRHDAQTNVLGTINVAEACRQAGIRRVVYAASGGSRFGAPTELPVAETCALAPVSPYAVSKVAAELYLQAYASMYGIRPISLGLANVYGPRQDPTGEAGVVSIFANAMLNGLPTTIFGDGTAARDYVYVGDVVDAFIRAAEAPDDLTGYYNIGTSMQTTVAELHRLIAAETGCTTEPLLGSPRAGEVQAIALDADRAKQDLGWTPEVKLAEGIKRTVAWLRDAVSAADSSEVRIRCG